MQQPPPNILLNLSQTMSSPILFELFIELHWSLYLLINELHITFFKDLFSYFKESVHWGVGQKEKKRES